MLSPIWVEPLKVERLTIAIADLPSSLVGLKLVQLSDLHYDGFCLSDQLLEQAICVSNQENPDVVLLTGDYITDDPTPINALSSRLKSLKSKNGIFACLGNHDIYYPNARTQVIRALNSAEITVLWNGIAIPFGPNFPIIGLADYWSREFRSGLAIIDHLDSNVPRIVLSHNPDTAEILKKWRVDLQLSGHTHGGQVFIPGLGSAPIIGQQLRKVVPKSVQKFIPYLRQCSQVAKHWEWAQGYHCIGNNQLYVNRGLGTYFPGRFFCPPELTVITLIN
ncbi:metallophosphatase [Aphanothece hegewaldii CCALA 016]|uniref:Metallophosphatase n=1 Tax=Aphanothece hegewaldii CCALA 016 TaxID=2107694 RepID=A0A2T1LYJ9_9CHRO|nr:metallophosphoesterase [Aphanothece hegewaldii]PSF37441.1 metallophosphatase [Aphanothece hegewaldii CCALA 016]